MTNLAQHMKKTLLAAPQLKLAVYGYK